MIKATNSRVVSRIYKAGNVFTGTVLHVHKARPFIHKVVSAFHKVVFMLSKGGISIS